MSTEESRTGGTLSRRQLLAIAAGSASAGVLSPTVKGLERDPTRVQGQGPSALGERSSFERIERKPVFGVVSLTPLEKLQGTIPPADLHFERHHAGIPTIDPGNHDLHADGPPAHAVMWDGCRHPQKGEQTATEHRHLPG